MKGKRRGRKEGEGKKGRGTVKGGKKEVRKEE